MRALLTKVQNLFNGIPNTNKPPKLRQPGRGAFSFLICGAGRGGTSLLTGMLDYHSDLEIGLEEGAVACLVGKKVTARGRNLFHRRIKALLKTCDKRAAAAGNKFYGNKITTEQLLALNDHNLVNPGQSIDVLDLFFNHYLAGIKVIFIVRDGRTCVRSKMARVGRSVEQACQLWSESIGVYRFLETRHQNNLRLRYEDLITAPEENLKKVCAFLGINFQPEMLSGTANRKLRKEYQHDGLDTSKLELKDIPAGCMERIRDELRYCGYIP
jgi:hypothetical protein